MKYVIKGLGVVVALLLVLVAVLVIRAQPMGDTPAGTVYNFKPDEERLIQSLQAAIRIRTISAGSDKPVAAEAFGELHAYLETRYPLVHATLTREIIGGYSLLYRWEGTAQDKKPALLLGHLDVVPISPGTEDKWRHDPFGGTLADGYIWGRGALDNKLNIIGILEAVEAMLAAGFTPERDIYFAFGHDEEIGGNKGAGAISKLLEQQRLEFEFVLDEGGAVMYDYLDGVDVPFALVAPAEKGIVNMKLETSAAGGHSMAPPPQTAIGVLAAGLARLEANQFPSDFSHIRSFWLAMADEMPFMRRVMLKNLWLFEPLIRRQIDNPSELAMTRTTTALTIFKSGVKSNVLPTHAEAVVNLRIMPGQTPQTVYERVVKTIDDPRVEVNFLGTPGTPSPRSPQSGLGWENLTASIRDTIAPGRVVIVPRLLGGATDTRHYHNVSRNVYRFTWIEMPPALYGTIHGTNERITPQNLVNAVRFYHRFMSRL